jgi:hypothetical protein
LMDVMIDGGTLAALPFGFYRASSGLNPEVIRMNPMDLYPLNDPQGDVNIPQLPSANQSFGFNMLTVLGGMEERLTMQSELSFGRVPGGKASALRTVRGMQAVVSQGEARPERILRRWFAFWSGIWSLMHQSNKRFLPKVKQFRVAGFTQPGESPYKTVQRADLGQVTDFDFIANIQNSSRAAQQSSLEALAGIYLGPVAIQLGIVQPAGIYRMLRDIGKSYGHDPDQYITPPNQGAMLPPVSAEEAITRIGAGVAPLGPPLEGAQAHMATLVEFQKNEEVFRAVLDTAPKLELYLAWMQQVGQIAQFEAQQAALAQAAQEQTAAAQGAGGDQGGGAPDGGGPPPLSGGNELLDEGLPGAGGGGADRLS